MTDSNLVANHYTHGSLVEAIHDGILKLGKTTDSVDIDDLSPVDEFHIGGRIATQGFLDQLDINASHHVLDVGCGLGGGSRFAAQKYGCRVTGVDLTPEYVDTGNIICSWVGFGDRIQLQVENALSLSQSGAFFDRAYMLHVGMNIADKQTLASEIYRVLQPGGRLGIYDVMSVGEGDLAFPVPWATGPESSAVAPSTAYKSALQDAGFSIISERNRREFALDFFELLQSKAASAGGPPPLGLHILMGSTAPQKVKNMIQNISRNLIAPIEIIAEKSA